MNNGRYKFPRLVTSDDGTLSLSSVAPHSTTLHRLLHRADQPAPPPSRDRVRFDECLICPECGKSYKPSGMVSHLIHIHGKKGDEISRAIDSAAKDESSSRFDKILGLMDCLEYIADKRAQMTQLDKQLPSVIRSEFKVSLDGLEKKTREQLDSLQTQKLPDPTKRKERVESNEN